MKTDFGHQLHWFDNIYGVKRMMEKIYDVVIMVIL